MHDTYLIQIPGRALATIEHASDEDHALRMYARERGYPDWVDCCYCEYIDADRVRVFTLHWRSA